MIEVREPQTGMFIDFRRSKSQEIRPQGSPDSEYVV